ncbi:hypothetical protein HHK36_009413 [Tetracentron sinense]|uniref:Epidermal patterning factor-like protein n=1 Tax=Tetracentron sinense TaxID=13715 RepID=A0A834ZG79_TETSI|nr:hypothetical protein HHK36_009413 [Tetracentron sinense]
MKNFIFFGVHTALLLAILLTGLTAGKSLRLTRSNLISFNGKGTSDGDRSYVISKEGAKEELGMELYPTGSSLPDCSHACGPCLPCKRVMVSFKCSVAESCPIVYRCMCKGRYYQVPSN